MTSNYQRIAAQNIKKYGTDIDRYGPVLLAHLYSDRTHFIFELLQNAEDARASQVHFSLYPDRLEVTHNGRPFTEADVRGICGLVEGTKAEDLTTIGRFGIGFKAVYAYTMGPEIHSGREHFRIDHYVRPVEVPVRPLDDGLTLFVFTLDRGQVVPTEAVRAIGMRLRSLRSRTLLFLRHIQSISWTTEDGVQATCRRESSVEGVGRRVVLTGQHRSRPAGEEWLVFDRSVAYTDTTLTVEIAFRLQGDSESGVCRVVGVRESPLVVFFPTEKETYLQFLIQGPYRTTPARDNVPVNDPLNRELIKGTALLLAETLPRLRDMGLLSLNTLEILPLRSSDFPADGMFRPLFERVCDTFRREALLPTPDHRFVAARHARLVRGGGLIQLLSDGQLRALFETRSPLAWLTDEITETRTPALRSYLLLELEVEEVTPEVVARRLSATFLQKQSDAWIAHFYAFLAGQEALWRGGSDDRTEGLLREKPFIRLQNRTHVKPFRADGLPNAYLPTAAASGFPTVRHEIASDKKARAFLQKLGLTEPDVVTEVIDVVLPKYCAPNVGAIKPAEHAADLRKIFQAFKTDSAQGREVLSARLRETPFLRGVNAATGTRTFRRPGEIYLHTPDLDCYFAGNPGAWFLDDTLQRYHSQLRALGVSEAVRQQSPSTNAQSQGGRVRPRQAAPGLLGFDPDCMLDGLDHAVAHPSAERARYLWNILLPVHIAQIRGAVDGRFMRGRSSPNRHAVLSQMGRALVDAPWLPAPDGSFARPGQLSLDTLPVGFARDEGLSDALGMAQTPLKLLATEAGLDIDDLEFLKQHLAEVRALKQHLLAVPEENREAGKTGQEPVGDGAERPYDAVLGTLFARDGRSQPTDERVPPVPLVDAARRRSKIAAEIATGRATEPTREERFRRVGAVHWEDKNHMVRIFLRENYDGRCQICDDAFRKRDGEPYFEGLYLVSRTDSRWLDRPGNVLCLCATCCAKFMYGPVESDDIAVQVRDYRPRSEGGTGDPVLKIKLCGHDEIIKFTEAHLLELQEILAASSVSQTEIGMRDGEQ